MKKMYSLLVFVLLTGMVGAYKMSIEPVYSESKSVFPPDPYFMYITNKTTSGFDYYAIPADLLNINEYIIIQVYDDISGDPLISPNPITLYGVPNHGHVTFSTTASNLNYFGQINYNGRITSF